MKLDKLSIIGLGLTGLGALVSFASSIIDEKRLDRTIDEKLDERLSKKEEE